MLQFQSCDFGEDQRRKLSDYYLKDEAELLRELCDLVDFSISEREGIAREASALVEKIRSDRASVTVFDGLLQEYGLSTHEGVQLMRLAEALIRTPDFRTRRLLIRDKLWNADWATHAGQSKSFRVNQATNALRVARAWIGLTGKVDVGGALARLGDRVLVAAMNRAMTSMGKHFVLGQTIQEAHKKSRISEHTAYSYDMLGEAARTHADADRYFNVYLNAIQSLASNTADNAAGAKPGLSVKLSALHPRFELAQQDVCLPVLIERMKALCAVAASADLWINIDAEECDRTELTLDVFAALLSDERLADWDGLGLVVQAYQRRALPMIDYITQMARSQRRRVSVRLVKGAYWDSEIKRAQELGLADYPVFTRKENTDVSYIACAQKLFEASDAVFPQFATHNAHTAIAVAKMARGRPFEFQRLHGMGKSLHDQLSKTYDVLSRVYAPVGRHRELLPYLVRRLLENGANSSFVNQIYDDEIGPGEVAFDPFDKIDTNRSAAHPAIPSPKDILGDVRNVAAGHDLTQRGTAKHFEGVVQSAAEFSASSIVNGVETGAQWKVINSPQDFKQLVGKVRSVAAEDVARAVEVAKKSSWSTSTTVQVRAYILREAADLIEAETDKFVQLCVLEAGKTLPDAIAEIREAVDFCRYYAVQASRADVRSRQPIGTVACISPWNFPLAIFLGQVTAALSVGNTVVAKPPPQTPFIAYEAVQLLYRAGVPADALHLLIGDGAMLGTALTRHPDIMGICFTGSTRTAQLIARNLAETSHLSIPFIAETGGINAMIVDATSLLEQAVQDVIDSAFQSAGQRCSACRIVCVQSDVASEFVSMLKGAMATLTIGDPAYLATDVGPVIDAEAQDRILAHIATNREKGRVIYEGADPSMSGHFVAPTLIQLDHVSDLKEEIFGPVLHVVTYDSSELDLLIDEINALGFGLTMGLHTRIDTIVDQVGARASVGNLYVNRNQIGAVVGVQPFGGEGMSGTGPKAGGPNYLLRLSRPAGQRASPALQPDRLIKDQAAPDRTSSVNQSLTKARRALRNARSDQLTVFLSAAKVECGDRSFRKYVGADFNPPAEWQTPKVLPGPTGEQNLLKAVPRGIFLALGSSDLKIVFAQVLKCLATGNACLSVRSEESESVLEALAPLLVAAGMSPDMLQLVDPGQIDAFIQSDINGIIIEDGDLRLLENNIANRPGALLPILSSNSEAWEFFLERTVTINTAAAGGNASLFGRL